MRVDFTSPYDEQFEKIQFPDNTLPKTKIKLSLDAPVYDFLNKQPIGDAFAPFGGFTEKDQNTPIEYLEDIEENRARSQSPLELIGKAAGQTLAELTLGTLEGFGNALDLS